MPEKITKILEKDEKLLYSCFVDQQTYSKKKKTAAKIIFPIEISILTPLFIIILMPSWNFWLRLSTSSPLMDTFMIFLIIMLFLIPPIGTYIIYFREESTFPKRGHELWITSSRIISTISWDCDISLKKVLYFKGKRGMNDKLNNYFTLQISTEAIPTGFDIRNLDFNEFQTIRNILTKLLAENKWEEQ
ncbi:MAG: hypothetical protein EAX96_17085 [Candidatus Lokiarchaeota archaeon]|nr:hypothetical protein [Candidatus Lokiarchaeota archaeon]